MKAIYGDMRLSKGYIQKLVHKFKESVDKLEDAPWPGDAYHIIIPDSTVEAESLIWKNHHITLDR
jgi:hypothetical protein